MLLVLWRNADVRSDNKHEILNILRSRGILNKQEGAVLTYDI